MENKTIVREDFNRIALIRDRKWDHNRHYHKYLLKHLDKSIGLSLEIGCGKGEFARALAQRSKRVIGIDLSEKMTAIAKALTPDGNIEYLVEDVMEFDLQKEKYDCIASIATAHHLPMKELMAKAKDALRENGTFLILDLYQEEAIWDYIISAFAIPLNILMMLIKEGRLRVSEEEMNAWREHGKSDKYLTLKQVKAITQEIMPGAVIKRHFYWRYSIVWKKPSHRS